MGEDVQAARLVDSARDGDQGAWEHLYRGLYPRLRGYLERRVGHDDAEDAVSETMARAVAGIDRFQWGPAGFDGWVFGIARRVAADHYRGMARRRRQTGAAKILGETNPGSDVRLDDDMLRACDHARIRRAFLLLRPADRELLELRVVAGLSVEQVASVLGKRPGAVRTAQLRALTQLRALMGPEDR